MTAPFIPEVSSPTDTSNFDVDDSDFKHTVSSFMPYVNKLVLLLGDLIDKTVFVM